MAPAQRRLSRRALLGALFAVGLIGVATSVAAQDLTEEQWRAALESAQAGGELPDVATVEGRPADVSLLEDPDHRDDRIEAALGGAVVNDPPADELRARAAGILAQAAYTPRVESRWRRWLTDNPVTRWLQDRWERFVEWFTRRFGFGGSESQPGVVDPNRRAYGWALVAAVTVGAALVTWFVIRRRREDEPPIGWFDAVPEGLRTPEALEAEAAGAEAGGNLRAAVRYEFLAGLLRLDAAGRITFEPSSRMGDLRSQVRSGSFDDAAGIFERVVYSDHPATPGDLTRSRTAWDVVLRRETTG